ncbi:hypothetical protein V2G26_014766 [Clonostachys chloroleuca]
MSEPVKDSPLKLPLGPDALRASFGDRKIDVSRKITACVACRKQKIKCHMPDASVPCGRCKKRGLPCTVNRSLQMLLEDDASWKQTVTRKITALEEFMESAREQLNTRAGESAQEKQPSRQSDSCSPSTSDRSAKRRRRDWEIRMDTQSGPVTIPAACIGEVEGERPLGPEQPSSPPDIISEGIVTLDQAETLFHTYSKRLDHFLYRILDPMSSFSTVRERSPALLAAICTVASLHSEDLGYLFEGCHEHFVTLASQLSMSEAVNNEDIRGLCIGAFWLHGLSWNLVSIAVRAATQNQLHRFSRKVPLGDRTAYMHTRLWYLIYVCSHHFSIPYGRTPMIPECEAISSVSTFLASQHATSDDARLVSQVQIWTILGRAATSFGFDVDEQIPVESIPRLRRYIIALDTWRAEWDERFGPSEFVGEYPRKGVGMHYHFTKLYLCTHALRGLESRPAGQVTETRIAREEESMDRLTPGSSNSWKTGSRIHPELEEIGSVAISSAKSILRLIIRDPEFQSYLHGLSLYFDTMIIFAVVFLLRIATQYSDIVPVDKSELLDLVCELSRTLTSVTDKIHSRHLLVVICKGVKDLSIRYLQEVESNMAGNEVETTQGQALGLLDLENETRQHSSSDGLLLNSENIGFDWTDFDFLATQDPFLGNASWTFGV